MCTGYNKGFNQHLLGDLAELKTLQKFVGVNGKIVGFQEFLKV